jgi:hypothetical protein
MPQAMQGKKQATAAPKSSQSQLSSSLQSRGMSMESLMGQDDIGSLTGDAGKPSKDKTQSFARKTAQAFFSKLGALGNNKKEQKK